MYQYQNIALILKTAVLIHYDNLLRFANYNFIDGNNTMTGTGN